MSQLFEDLNDHIVFTRIKSRNEAIKMRDDAKVASPKKNVVVFFENRYHLYLKPGQDPYQVRREIEKYITDPLKFEESVTGTESEPVTPKTKKGLLKK